MSFDAPLLNRELLEELEGRWELQGVPVKPHPGLEEREIDAMTSPLGLRLPVEARTWWGWQNGASGALFGPGRTLLSLENAIELYEQELAIFHADDIAETVASLRPRERFPIMHSGGPVSCDCSVPEGAPTPIYHVDSHDYDIDGVENPRTRSFGELVQWWLDAFDEGVWQWDRAAGRWRRDESALDLDRSRSGLV